MIQGVGEYVHAFTRALPCRLEAGVCPFGVGRSGDAKMSSSGGHHRLKGRLRSPNSIPTEQILVLTLEAIPDEF